VTHQQQVLSLLQSPEANNAGWPDVSAKVDRCVANWCSLAKKLLILVIFPILILFFTIKC